jgi:hypothetical protein
MQTDDFIFMPLFLFPTHAERTFYILLTLHLPLLIERMDEKKRVITIPYTCPLSPAITAHYSTTYPPISFQRNIFLLPDVLVLGYYVGFWFFSLVIVVYDTLLYQCLTFISALLARPFLASDPDSIHNLACVQTKARSYALPHSLELHVTARDHTVK